MTSVQITEYGSTDKLAITEASGEAEPGEGQVLVRVTAASINRVDAALAAGYLSEMLPLQLPATIGGDFSGTVVRTGAGVDNVSAGEKVIGHAGVLLGGSGSFADHTVAPARLVAKAPNGIDLAAAAALPLVGASAVQALQTLDTPDRESLCSSWEALEEWAVWQSKSPGTREQQYGPAPAPPTGSM